jgi:hypothetical protein
MFVGERKHAGQSRRLGLRQPRFRWGGANNYIKLCLDRIQIAATPNGKANAPRADAGASTFRSGNAKVVRGIIAVLERGDADIPHSCLADKHLGNPRTTAAAQDDVSFRPQRVEEHG